MAGYIAKTHEDWAVFLKDEEITDNINFWSPSPKPLRISLPGNRIYFFAKTPPENGRRIVGWGAVREYFELTVRNAWERFGHGNGAPNLPEMIRRLNSFPGRNQLGGESEIGCTIVDDVVWLDHPVDLALIGINVAGCIVRGRTTEPNEEDAIDNAGR
ncbi:MAG: hypothetical protein HY261_06195 [Chloroflexi bacterium]|nr:hypothetical protein [Chloroflexota bacterium]